MSPSTPPPADSPTGSEEPPAPPDLPATPPSWAGHGLFGLDRLGLTQAIGGLALGLIALFSSYDHISFFGHTIAIPQQWGIPFIAASVAAVLVDAQLASGSRLRAAHEADRERNRAAEARKRKRQATARQDRCALLSARVLLEPSEANRARLRAFLALISQPPLSTRCSAPGGVS